MLDNIEHTNENHAGRRIIMPVVVSIVLVVSVVNGGCTAPLPEQAVSVTQPPVSALTPGGYVFGGNGDDEFNAVAINSDDSIIAAGYTISANGDFDPTHGGMDALLVKFTPQGSVVWKKTLGGTKDDVFRGVAIEANGNIAAVGVTYSSDGDFDKTHGGEDALVAEFSPDGTMNWSHTLGGVKDDEFNAVAIDADGSIVSAGSTASSDGDFGATGGNAAVIATFGPDGTLDWANTFGNSTDSFQGVTTNPDNTIIAVGLSYSDSGDFMTDNTIAGAGIVAKVSDKGGLIWPMVYQNDYGDEFCAVTLGADGSIFAAGTTSEPVPRLDHYSITTSGGLLVSFDVQDSGFDNWSESIGGNYQSYATDAFTSVAAGTDGSVVVAGYHQQLINDGTGLAELATYSSDGTRSWNRIMVTGTDNGFNAVAVAADGTIVAAGYSGAPDGDFPATHGGKDAVLAIFTSEGLLHN